MSENEAPLRLLIALTDEERSRFFPDENLGDGSSLPG